MPHFAAVLFDLDGTLLDTAPDLGAAVNHVLSANAMPPLDDEVIRRIASDGALGLLKAGFGEEQLAQMDTPLLRQALLDYYAAHLYEGTHPYPAARRHSGHERRPGPQRPFKSGGSPARHGL